MLEAIMSRLYIAEKPSLGRAIAAALRAQKRARVIFSAVVIL
ncbi:DNA topoisomerase III [Vibrio astriarenae]|nr:DNA topoisomerase III [Vibrio sp. C7]